MKQIKEILIASVSLFLLGFGICMAVSTFFMYREGEQEYEALREYVNEEEREEDESEEQDSTLASKATVDFQALRKINSDIIAWIRIPDTKIDYPIVQGKNNAYYLKHMFQKTEHNSRKNVNHRPRGKCVREGSLSLDTIPGTR